MEENIHHVLVFGSAGVGKTSVINELTGQKKTVGNGAKGVTFETTGFEPIVRNNKRYKFWDTVGLNEPSIQKESSPATSGKESLKLLISFLKNHKEGLNLLIMVNKGRLLSQHVNNYLLFYEKMTGRKIPIICVVTQCEDSEPISNWINEAGNRDAFDQNGLVFANIVCTSFAQSKKPKLEETYKEYREESALRVWQSIENICLELPVNFVGKSFWPIIISMWNFICSYLPLFSPYKSRSVRQILLNTGLSEKEADQLSQQIAEEFE